ALNAELTDKQREALELLAGTPTGIGTPALAARGIAADAISRLARHGYISVRQDRVERDPWSAADADRFATGSRSGLDQVSGGLRSGLDQVNGGLRSGLDQIESGLRSRELTGEQSAALARLGKLTEAGAFRV